jgi:hypothetical protein
MKTTIISVLLILTVIVAAGISMTGCGKTAPVSNNPVVNVADDTGTEFVEANPDLGTLDDSQVSDELPQ